MTAFSEFERLEAEGIWREHEDAQRLNVIVSVGEATLTITDAQERPLSHWSLPALDRINPGERPALFRPSADSSELLEIADDDFVDALRRLRQALERRRPHPGRLRTALRSIGLLFLAGILVFWLPKAMIAYTARVVPEPRKVEFGGRILTQLARVGGTICAENGGQDVLDKLSRRLFAEEAPKIVVVRSGVAETASLPGRHIVLNRAIVEDHLDPGATAGYVVAEHLRQSYDDPTGRFLSIAGLRSAFSLLTSGEVPGSSIDKYVEYMLTAASVELEQNDLVASFMAADIPGAPYGYAFDITGEKTISLIEMDQDRAPPPRPVLSDDDWVRLQGICGE